MFRFAPAEEEDQAAESFFQRFSRSGLSTGRCGSSSTSSGSSIGLLAAVLAPTDFFSCLTYLKYIAVFFYFKENLFSCFLD
jgi:hypothetical protein